MFRAAFGAGAAASRAASAGVSGRGAVAAQAATAQRGYHKSVVDHYENPRNVGSLDKDDPNVGTGLVGAPACGDVMKLQIRVNDDGEIVESKFKTFGCGSAIASSSLATEWIKGMKGMFGHPFCTCCHNCEDRTVFQVLASLYCAASANRVLLFSYLLSPHVRAKLTMLPPSRTETLLRSYGCHL